MYQIVAQACIIILIRNILTKLDDLVLFFKKKNKRNIPPNSILIIRWDRIGDAVATLPFIKKLKKLWPEATVDIVCSKSNSFIFKNNENINQIISLDGVGYTYGLKRIIKFIWYTINPSKAQKYLKKLPNKKYDLCFDLVHGEYSMAFKKYSEFFIGPKSQDGTSWIYDYYPSKNMAYDDFQISQYYLNIVCEAYNLPPATISKSILPPFHLTCKIKQIIEKINTDFYLVNISGTEAFRSFKTETLITLLNQLSQKKRVIIFDDPQQDVLSKIKTSLSKHIDILPPLSLPEISVIAKRSKLYIGIEGGASHYISCFCPSMVLFTPKSYKYQFKLWLPTGHTYTNIFENNQLIMVSNKKDYLALLQKPKKSFPFKPYYVFKEPLDLSAEVIIDSKNKFLKSIQTKNI